MIDTTVLDNWISKKRGESVSIVLAGRIFGGRYGESPQEPKGYEYGNNTLTIRFGTTELLELVEPESVSIGPHHELAIPRAKSAVWCWHYYGRDQTPENWCTESYVLHNVNTVQLTVHGPISTHIPTRETFLYGGDQFVLLI
jgi:hypothetical protein